MALRLPHTDVELIGKVASETLAVNPAQRNAYTVEFDRLKNAVYMVQSVTIPAVQLGQLSVATPFINFPYPGEKMGFGEFAFTFVVDETFFNYKLLLDWQEQLGFPDSYSQVQELIDQGISPFSDASVTFLKGDGTPGAVFRFIDVFPVSLSSFEGASTDNDVTEITVDASFAVRKFTVER